MYFGPILRHFRFRVKLGVLFGNLRFCWAYIGPLRAYVRPYNILGQLEGYMLGLSWPKWPYWVISRLCWAYLGSCAGVLGHLEGYVEILEGYKAICGYFEPSVLELERSVCLRPFFLHGSSTFEFLVLCCMQPLGCVMCKKHCKYREKLTYDRGVV